MTCTPSESAVRLEEPAAGNYFVAVYPPFSCWNDSGVERLRDRLRRDRAIRSPLGVYVHIPFCVKRCHYCYYYSHDDRSEYVDRYLEAVVRELRLWTAAPAMSRLEPDFVYVGGGTPSLLSQDRVHRLFEGLREASSWGRVREFTFECAPRSVSFAKMQALREAGVTRISLGVQQLDDDVLRRNGRVHRVRDVFRAYDAIRASGFDVVNLDLMVGLPGETQESFLCSLERTIAMQPDSVTIYQLEIPLNTPLFRSLRDGTESDPADWEVKRSRLVRGFARLEEAGYTVRSAYSAVREPEKHPFVYQDEQYRGASLLGLGASAFSYLDGTHVQNLCALDDYLAVVERSELPLHRGYALREDERLVREFVLQLKLGRVEAEPFARRFRIDPLRRFAEPLRRCAEAGWLRVGRDAVTVTREGLARVDRLLPVFYLPEHRGVRYS
jgi:oxygen-independent coproporphyrinogen-3 oxidase